MWWHGFSIGAHKHHMKKILGIIFLVVGILMVLFTGFSFTKKEKVVDAGPIDVSVNKKHSVNWPPYAGGILAVAGLIMLVVPDKRS